MFEHARIGTSRFGRQGASNGDFDDGDDADLPWFRRSVGDRCPFVFSAVGVSSGEARLAGEDDRLAPSVHAEVIEGRRHLVAVEVVAVAVEDVGAVLRERACARRPGRDTG